MTRRTRHHGLIFYGIFLSQAFRQPLPAFGPVTVAPEIRTLAELFGLMCRLLMLINPRGVAPGPHLESFRQLCRNSREYQGHGWGCAWIDQTNQWRLYHNLSPIWQDPEKEFPRTRLFLAHARSAFRDEGIVIENNMPFSDDHNVFLFNGELQGVRIRAEGRIGAEKIFNAIKRLDHGNLAAAVERGVALINKRTRYIRAMNFFLANRDEVHLCSLFNQEPDYFQLHQTDLNGTHITCSSPYPGTGLTWIPVPNHTIRTIPLHAPS